MTLWNEVIWSIILIVVVAENFILMSEVKKLRKQIEGYIKKDAINKGGKNGGAW